MRILVIYHQKPRVQRKAISSHLKAFGQYHPNTSYWNIAFGLPKILRTCNFDCIIFHFTFFIPNINKPFTEKQLEEWKFFSTLNAYKAAIIQDEYVNTLTICQFLKNAGVKEIFTCLPESLYQTVYPTELTGVQHYHTVLTGYIDEYMLKMFEGRTKNHHERTIDIAYRARKMPYNLGIFGTFKWKLTEIFNEVTKNSNLTTDISNDPNDFLFGDAWYEFMGNARTTLGCEGGSSLHDPDGSIRKKVTAYVLKYPDATFEDTRETCFKGQDEQFPYYALSPRHLEAAVSRTCQVLIEGNYNGVLIPEKHYIPIKKDWSNLEDVIEKIKDKKYCESITERTYNDLVKNGKFHYKDFVEFILSQLSLRTQTRTTEPNNLSIKLLTLFSQYPFLFAPIVACKRISIEGIKRIIWFLGVDKYDWFKKIELKVLGTSSVR